MLGRRCMAVVSIPCERAGPLPGRWWTRDRSTGANSKAWYRDPGTRLRHARVAAAIRGAAHHRPGRRPEAPVTARMHTAPVGQDVPRMTSSDDLATRSARPPARRQFLSEPLPATGTIAQTSHLGSLRE